VAEHIEYYDLVEYVDIDALASRIEPADIADSLEDGEIVKAVFRLVVDKLSE